MSVERLVEQLLSGVSIIPYTEEGDFDDPYAIADAAEGIFKECKIGVSRDNDLELVAMSGEDVVGALMSSNRMANDGGDDFIEVNFDVAVRPEFQKSGIGLQLTKAGLSRARELSDGGEIPVKVRLLVVNRNMEKILAELGFSDGDEERHGNGSCHMEKWL